MGLAKAKKGEERIALGYAHFCIFRLSRLSIALFSGEE
jgi:hypothetical protein